jgi:transcriptional regulator with XRE-family HTH domain
MDLGLDQKEVAQIIGVSVFSIIHWENGQHAPEIGFIPTIIRFLGYDPDPEPTSLGERMLAARRRLGITQRQLARRLAVDPTSVMRWERQGKTPTRALRERIEAFLRPHLRRSRPHETGPPRVRVAGRSRRPDGSV